MDISKKTIDITFWPVKLWVVPKFRFIGFWIFVIGFYEGAGGWMLFGITINDFRGLSRERARFTLTLFGRDFRFGVSTEAERSWRVSDLAKH